MARDKLKDYKLDPPEPKPPRCPVCMAETDTFKRGYWGDIVGCDKCISDVDAWDYEMEHDNE